MGGVDVRRVAGQEHATVPVARDLSFIAMEPGFPAHLEQARVGVHDPRKDTSDLVLIDGLGVGQLIAAVPDHRPVPRAVGVVPVVGDQEREVVTSAVQCQAAARRPVREFDIGEHDRGQDGPAGKIRAHQSADRAVGTVGADHITCPPTELVCVAAV